jgi:hypothetical protein
MGYEKMKGWAFERKRRCANTNSQVTAARFITLNVSKATGKHKVEP